jgi:hypothetical protein
MATSNSKLRPNFHHLDGRDPLRPPPRLRGTINQSPNPLVLACNRREPQQGSRSGRRDHTGRWDCEGALGPWTGRALGIDGFKAAGNGANTNQLEHPKGGGQPATIKNSSRECPQVAIRVGLLPARSEAAHTLSGTAGEATLPSADRARQQRTEKLPVLAIEAPHLHLF